MPSLAATASRTLARASKDVLHVRLQNGDELTRPKALTRLLSHLLIEMGQGSALTVERGLRKAASFSDD